MIRFKRGILLLVGCPLFLLSCTQKPAVPLSPEEVQIARGKAIYQSNCTACHNSDPKKPGPIGPEIFGSSEELLRTRFLKNAYPPGYTPKRSTQAMPLFPQFESEIPAIHAYLNK